MSKHPLPLKPKISPKQPALALERRIGMTATEVKSKVRPLDTSMKLSLTISPSESQCMKDVDCLPPPSATIPSSQINNALRCTTTTGSILSKLLQPEHAQLHGVSESMTSPLSQNLLERMGLGDQMLMIRLGLLLRTCPNPMQTCSCSDLSLIPKEVSSSAPVMRKGTSAGTMCGIGKSLEEGHHGGMMKRQLCQPLIKLTSCEMPTPSTLSKLSKVSNPREGSQTSHLSSGEMSLQINKSTSGLG